MVGVDSSKLYCRPWCQGDERGWQSEREQRASTGATAECARGLGHPLCGRQGCRAAVHEGGVASAAWRPRPGHASAIEAF